MIVALVGTNPYSFDRLVAPLDEIAGRKGLDVFVQLGNTTYEPRNCKYERFVEHARLLEKMAGAEVVITHGGFGSIRDALSLGKPVIAVPRQPALGESQDYQEEMVRAFEDEGYVIGLYDMAQLESALDRAHTFKIAPRKGSDIPTILQNFLGEWY